MEKEKVIVWIYIIYIVSLPLIITVVVTDKIKRSILPQISQTIETRIDTTFKKYNIIVE